jgi:hypothetical protein
MPINPKIRAALGLDRGPPNGPLVPQQASMVPQQALNANGVTPGMNGLFGQMTQQANAASAGLPGFNYVPPQVGPAPVPAAAAGAAGQLSLPELQGMARGGMALFAPPEIQQQMMDAGVGRRSNFARSRGGHR